MGTIPKFRASNHQEHPRSSQIHILERVLSVAILTTCRTVLATDEAKAITQLQQECLQPSEQGDLPVPVLAPPDATLREFQVVRWD